MQNRNLIFGILLLSSPILFTLLVFSDTFSFSWNQGRGGFIFALVFVVAELVGLKIPISGKKLIFAVPVAVATMLYFVGLEVGLREYMESAAEFHSVQLIHSWIWMWDYIVMTAFAMVVLTILFGRRWIRIAPAGPIFLTGSGIILSLDAFFPYDTLGPLQYVVPYLVQTNVWLISVFDLGIATARDNIMFLRGDHGSMALQVFWPSAGVHSVIIYSLVMGAFLLKMNITRGRKSVYFVLGIVGTIFVNVIRIFSLSWYALKVTTDAQKWEAFHEIAGEILFLPWLFAFLLIVILVESSRLKKIQAKQGPKNSQ